MPAGSTVTPAVAVAIEAHIDASKGALDALVTGSRLDPTTSSPVLVTKYVPVFRTQQYTAPNDGLYIGDESYTWGTGTYITPITTPVSTAIYGRVGVVAQCDPTGWRTFDARDDAGTTLYLRWLRQQPTFGEAVLTVHANHWLHELRNAFREQFHIDCVLFRPDEWDVPTFYTDRDDDTWLAVSDWAGGGLARGFSDRFLDVKAVVVVEEEFAILPPGMARTPLMSLRGPAALTAPTPDEVRQAYIHNQLLRVAS